MLARPAGWKNVLFFLSKLEMNVMYLSCAGTISMSLIEKYYLLETYLLEISMKSGRQFLVLYTDL